MAARHVSTMPNFGSGILYAGGGDEITVTANNSAAHRAAANWRS